ncbi:MAG: polysaccharide biosynthesis protein, partial [Pseudomonadota bacterium]
MTDQIRQFLVHLNKPTKLALSVAVDLCIVPLALWLAFFFRLGFERMIDPAAYGWLFLAAIATAIPVFVIAGLYSAILRYMDRDTIVRLFTAVSVAALLLALVIYWARSDLLIPRTVVANYWLLLFGGIGGIRFVARAFLLPGQRHPRLASLLHPRTQSEGIRRVAIYGAGSAGVQLYRNIEHEPDLLPVAFIDDDPSLRRRLIGGMRIVSREDIGTLIKKMGLQEVFLAMPSLEPAERQRILEHLEPLPVHVRTVPSLFDLTTGKKGLQELQEVRVEDMLGREVVHPAPELMARCITNKTVMVTGGGGSIGAELCRQILELNPKQLIVFEHSEFNLFSIEDE